MMGVFRVQAEPYDDERGSCCGFRHVQKNKLGRYLVLAVLVGSGIGALAWLINDATKEPRYSAAIASVSGLDRA